MGKKIDIDDKLVIESYTKLKNIHKVAKYFKVSIGPIKRILTKNNLILTNRRYVVNDLYFDNIDTEEKAYWLGFLFADGYIRERKTGNSLEIKLSVKDSKHLELFRDSLESNHQIVYSENKVKYKGGFSVAEMCHLAIYSSKLVSSIKKQGVHSRKTFTIKKPDIKPELIHHFIRGYFDGDGCFTYIKNIKNATNIACASNDFREFLIEELHRNDINIKYYGGIQLYLQNKIDNLKFYDYIYKNSTIYLDRKKEKYEEFRKDNK
jgi:intein-encoded DNA endonuclease-like protein